MDNKFDGYKVKFSNAINKLADSVYKQAILDYRNMLCEHCVRQKNECNELECPFHGGDGCDIVNIADKLISHKNRKCGECKRYGDLDSSCFKARFLEANPDDDACEDFK